MKHLFLKNLVLGSALIAVSSSCAVAIRMPANRFDSPEVIGKKEDQPVALAINGGIESGSEVVFTPNLDFFAPNMSSPDIDRSGAFRASAGLSVLDNLEVDFKTPLLAGVKYQLLGQPRSTAEAGNFSLAATLYGGPRSESASASAVFSNEQRHVDMSGITLDGAIIAGYRMTGSMMFYGGPFIIDTTYSGSYQDTVNGATTTTDLSGNARQYGGNLGLELGASNFYTRIEFAAGNTRAANAQRAMAYLGLVLGSNF